MPHLIYVALGSAIISLFALVVSAVTLWKTHFSAFSPICSTGDLGLRIFPIRSEGDKWYIPSLDVAISVTNNGARPGTVQDLRLALHYPGLPIPGNREFIYPRFEIDTIKFQKTDRNRFKWLDDVKTGNWMPFHVLAKQTVTKHILFESRWEEPVIQALVDCFLELKTSEDDEWRTLAQWRLSLARDVWTTVFMSGSGMAFRPGGASPLLPHLEPADLHKYTGSKEPLPEQPIEIPPSSLDYPDQKDGS